MFGCRDSGEEFLPFLLVAKGKRLIGRLLPFLKRDAAFNVLRIMTSNLPLLMSKDTEEVQLESVLLLLLRALAFLSVVL